MTQLASPPSDAVSEVLQKLGVRSTIFCLSELRAPWAFRVSGEPVAKFHLVLTGSALLFGADQSVSLGAGDLVVLPRGDAHALAGGQGSAAPPLERLIAEHGSDDGRRLRYGGSGPLTQLLCGGFALTDGVADSTLDLLPDVLQLPSPQAGTWLATLLTDLRQEAEGGRPGASAIVTKITDVFLAQALRSWLLDEEGDRFVDARAILDGPIANAVQALNTRPSEPWSLDRLARHVGLSRTALATRFREGVGEPPMRYLAELRLRRGAAELADGQLTLHEIARRAGYATEAAFAKAFKRRFGQSPGAYRDSSGGPPRVELAPIG